MTRLRRTLSRVREAMSFKTLWQGKFISVISPENIPYEAVHEGDGVIILPIWEKQGRLLIGIRSEYCPPYMVKTGVEENWLTVMSGMREEGESEEQAALRELKEESGVEPINPDVRVNLSLIPVFKSSTYRASVVTVAFGEATESPASGDGSKSEAKSKTLWIPREELEDRLRGEQKDLLVIFLWLLVRDYDKA